MNKNKNKNNLPEGNVHNGWSPSPKHPRTHLCHHYSHNIKATISPKGHEQAETKCSTLLQAGVCEALGAIESYISTGLESSL